MWITWHEILNPAYIAILPWETSLGWKYQRVLQGRILTSVSWWIKWVLKLPWLWAFQSWRVLPILPIWSVMTWLVHTPLLQNFCSVIDRYTKSYLGWYNTSFTFNFTNSTCFFFLLRINSNIVPPPRFPSSSKYF